MAENDTKIPQIVDSIYAFKHNVVSFQNNGIAAIQNNAVNNSKPNKSEGTLISLQKNDEFQGSYSEIQKKLKKEFEDKKNHQGCIGKAWDWTKNHLGTSRKSKNVLTKGWSYIVNSDNGSKSVEEKISKLEKSTNPEEIEKIKEVIKNYSESQKGALDMAADIVSGITSFGCYMVTAAGLVAIPFTGGSSLLVTSGALAATAAAGSVIKAGIKYADAKTGGQKYDSLNYDLITGGISGLLAPITAGIGGAVGKTIATRLGIQVMKEGTEELAVQVGTKGLLEFGNKYVGGNLLKRGLTYAAEASTVGATFGAPDGYIRHGLNTGNWTDKEAATAFLEGGLGGAIAGPFMDGGLRLVSKVLKPLSQNLNKKITNKVILPDGTATTFKQSQNDCHLLALLNSYIQNPTTSKQMAKMIETLPDGNYRVKVGNIPVIVKKADLDNDALAEGSMGIKILEKAYETIGGLDGGFAEVVAKDFGLSPVCISRKNINDELLDTLAKQGNDYILTAGAYVAENGSLTINPTKQRHLLSINRINSDAKTIILTDSNLGTGHKIQMSYEEFKKIFHEISGGKLNNSTDNLFIASQRQINEEKFRSLFGFWEGLKEAENIVSQKEPYNPHIPNQLEKAALCLVKPDKINTARSIVFDQATKARHNRMDTMQVIQQARQMGLLDNLQEQLPIVQIQKKTEKEIYQSIIERSVGGTKILQTLSSNEDFMKKLSPDLQEVVHNLKSNCQPSRTLKEASEKIRNLFGGHFLIKQSWKAASIAETFIGINNKNGETVVIKMVKKGINEDYLDKDKNLILGILKNNISDQEELQKHSQFIDNLYASWKRELRMDKEAENASKLAANAKRYTVSEPIAQKKDVIVMKRALGLSFDDIFKMLKFRELNGHEAYLQKYSDVISKNLWLKNPDKYTTDLARIYIGASNEMGLIPKRGGNYMHGDAHQGNVFAPKDLSKAHFIDTGLIFYRTEDEVIENLGFMLDYVTGNTQNLARRIIMTADTLPKGVSEKDLTKKLASSLDKYIYRSDHNISNPNYNQQIIDELLENLGIKLPANKTGYLKASLQFAMTSEELNSLAGRRVDTEFLIPDIALGIREAFKINPKKTMNEINSAVQHVIVKDGKLAGRTLGQFLPKEVRNEIMRKYKLSWISDFFNR